MGDHVGMVRRHELTDVEWEVLSGLLPRSSSGRPRLDDRRVLNGIVWKLRTGSAWRDVGTVRALADSVHAFPRVGAGRDVHSDVGRGPGGEGCDW